MWCGFILILINFYLHLHVAVPCYHHLCLSSWKTLSVCEHMATSDSLPEHPCHTLLCFMHGGGFQPRFFWKQAISCCQYVCCFPPVSRGSVSGEGHFPRSSVYLCYVVWVGMTWWTAGCHMFPQNLSVSRSFPVAGWEHGVLGLSHVVGWFTWTGLFDVKVTIDFANVWPSIICICWVKNLSCDFSFSDLVLRAGFILTSNSRH